MIMRKLPFHFLILMISIGLVAVSCSDTGTGIEESGTVTFTGTVENTGSQNAQTVNDVEGAVVTAARVTADGNLQTIGNAQAETNAEGEYTLQVELDAFNNADASTHIVIVAEKNGQQAKSFVAADIESGTTVTVQPITFESSAEASVFQQVVANGDADIITKAYIEVIVDSDVAADIESSAQNAAEVAAALAAAAEAKTQFYAEKGIEISEEQQEQIVDIKQQAMVRLASELDGGAEKEAAFQNFLQAVANAELEAGVEAWAAAESNDFAARVLVQESAELSAEAQSSIRKHSYYITAVTLNTAVRAQAEALGASESTINAISDAGATLQTNIISATNATEVKVNAFFTEFNEAVVTAIRSDASLNGSAFANIDTAIATGGLKSTLEATLSGTINIGSMVDAYSQFSSGVQTLVSTTFTEASETEVEAYTRLLVLLNIAT